MKKNKEKNTFPFYGEDNRHETKGKLVPQNYSTGFQAGRPQLVLFLNVPTIARVERTFACHFDIVVVKKWFMQ